MLIYCPNQLLLTVHRPNSDQFIQLTSYALFCTKSVGTRHPYASLYMLGTWRGYVGIICIYSAIVLRFNILCILLEQKLQNGCLGNSAIWTVNNKLCWWQAVELHWLPPVVYRIQFKLALVMFTVHTRCCPDYLGDSVQVCKSDPARTRLRSASSSDYTVPRTKFGNRAISVAGPVVWKSLPAAVRETDSLHSFRRKLKTHLFTLCFNDWLTVFRLL